jgi:hypothetical protein
VRSPSRPTLTSAIIAALVLAALLPATASADAVTNDDFADADALSLNTVLNDNNVGASTEVEAFTRNDDLCEGRAMGGTLWWKFTGNGQPMTVSTKGSGIDTVLAVWRDDGGGNFTLSGCSDDVANSSTRRYSEVRTNATTNGATYYVQVGGLCTSFDGAGDCDDWVEGNLSVAAWTQPSNDTRASAAEIHDHHLASTETRGAREDAGETLQCPTNTTPSPYGKTVWYRFAPPGKGEVHLTAGGFDTVMAVYDGNSSNFMTCFDDPAAPTGSHIAFKVLPGHTYFIQVGGFGSGRLADAGKLEVELAYIESTDWDEDGSAAERYGGADCDDGNPGIKPGVDDIPNNDVDENCDKYKDYDRDGDGFRVTVPERSPKPTNWDCNDTPGIGARIHPGARDIRGNSLNEDCVGGAAKAIGLPSQVTDYWKPAGGGVRVDRMKVNPALKRSRIKILCSGPGCPFGHKTIRVKRRTKALTLTGLFSHRVFHTGAVLQVRVLPPSREWIGRSETYRIHGSNVSATKGCYSYAGRKAKCPS